MLCLRFLSPLCLGAVGNTLRVEGPLDRGERRCPITLFVVLHQVFVLCTTWFGEYYILRMPMLAACIRAIVVHYPGTGPALNPMLGTTWALFKNG